MSEVHRYKAVTMISAAGATISYDPYGPDVVMAADFDQRDAALGELKRYQSLFNQAQKAIDRINELHRKRMSALQQRLTAADERADVLDGLLREASVELHDFITGSLLDRIDATLKPAEAPYVHSGEDDFSHREREACERNAIDLMLDTD